MYNLNNIKFKGKNVINNLIKCYCVINRKSSSGVKGNVQDHLRNIGILAHIDAGKTTTTERMLFYSGKTATFGEVHHGNTVTDYLAQERERGITICSAAVTFPWDGYKINLLDTPGHIDFTMEVEQSLTAVDGTIIILDASAGVEAQTITVWEQSNQHKLPKIIFANKMDRTDGNYQGCLNDIKNKLNALPIPLQYPIVGTDKRLIGIIDVLQLKELRFEGLKDGRNDVKAIPLEMELLRAFQGKRNEIIDTLSGIDDELAEIIIHQNSFDNLDTQLIMKIIRRCTINQKIVPVLLGSAYKNIGVQPLIDAIVSYLPSPNERNQLYDCFGNDFVGKVFKVTHDKQRGPLSLVRVLRGKLRKGTKVTTSNGQTEVLQKLYEPLADEYREINEIGIGDVCVCAGLKNTSTGDLLVTNLSSLKSAEKNLKKIFEKQHLTTIKSPVNEMTDDDLNLNEFNQNFHLLSNVFKLQPKIPDAVFFCSIEPPSLSHQLPLENALKQLQREDPSLRVTYDEKTMQTVLGGMGELHLDIIKSRILSEYKIDAELGPLQIAYKETLGCDVARDSFSLEKEISGSKQFASIELSLVKDNNVLFKLDTSPEATENLLTIRPRYMNTVRKAALDALESGPRVGGQIIDTQIVLHNLQIGRGTVDSFLIAVTSQCIQKILLKGGCRLLEPIMSLQIISPTDKVSTILSDLGRRRTTILEINARGDANKIINALTPLAELSGYSSILRTITSGSANMSMQPYGYTLMEQQDEYSAIRKTQGLE